jgi:hypothetical protein
LRLEVTGTETVRQESMLCHDRRLEHLVLGRSAT